MKDKESPTIEVIEADGMVMNKNYTIHPGNSFLTDLDFATTSIAWVPSPCGANGNVMAQSVCDNIDRKTAASSSSTWPAALLKSPIVRTRPVA